VKRSFYKKTTPVGTVNEKENTPRLRNTSVQQSDEKDMRPALLLD